MNNLWSQEYSQVRSHAQYNVKSVLEVHVIADSTPFGRTKLLQVTKMSFKRLLRSQISKSFSCSVILTPRRRTRRVVDLKVPNI